MENIVFKEFLDKTDNIDKIKFWRTQDKKEIDFIVDNKAYEIKYKLGEFKMTKYNEFIIKYPEIKLNFLDFDMILKKFYGWNF